MAMLATVADIVSDPDHYVNFSLGRSTVKLVTPLDPSAHPRSTRVSQRFPLREVRTVIVVDPDPMSRTMIVSACDKEGLEGVGFECQIDAIDWLWERGRDVSAAYLNMETELDQSAESLASVLSRDWPSVIVYDSRNMIYQDCSKKTDEVKATNAKQIASMLSRSGVSNN